MRTTDFQNPKFLLGLFAVFLIIVCFFSGRIISGFSIQVAIVFFLSVLIFAITLVNTDVGLAVMIFSMLLSPEIIIGQVPGRDVVIRFDDLMLAVITFSWLANYSESCVCSRHRGSLPFPSKGRSWPLRSTAILRSERAVIWIS